jgi:hypothetical protein
MTSTGKKSALPDIQRSFLASPVLYLLTYGPFQVLFLKNQCRDLSPHLEISSRLSELFERRWSNVSHQSESIRVDEKTLLNESLGGWRPETGFPRSQSLFRAVDEHIFDRPNQSVNERGFRQLEPVD